MSSVRPDPGTQPATASAAATTAALDLGAPRAAREALTARERAVRLITSSALTVIVVLIAVLWSIPTFGLFISSFRPAADIQGSGWWNGLVPPWHFTIQNYQQVLQAQGMGQAFLNSLIISIPGTILPILVAAFAAFAFAWMKFPGRDWIFLAIVALLVVPVQVALIPDLSIFTTLGITGTYLSIWLAHTAFGLPFAVYLLRSFFGGLPADLFESARIDGASNVGIFFRILLPLSVPALASLVIFQFMWVWNDLLVALIFLGANQAVAPMTVKVASLVNSFGSNYQILTAAAFISMALPLVVFFGMQRYFVRGILAGSIKG
jgi:alpha-glucoside transport system permease protein